MIEVLRRKFLRISFYVCFLVALSVSAVQSTSTKRRSRLLHLNPTARLKQLNKALWPSGKAKVCNTSIPGSIPGGASNATHPKGCVFALEPPPFIEPALCAERTETGTQHSRCARNSGYAPKPSMGEGSIFLFDSLTVRIRHSKIGELAHQAQSERIFAEGEIPRLETF